MRRPKRSTLLLGVVLLLLATVPVLIPLLVTNDDRATVGPEPVPVAAATDPTAVAGAEPDPSALPRAGSLVPTTASPTASPSPTAATPTPVPAPTPTTTAAAPAPAATTATGSPPPAPPPTDPPTVTVAGPDLVLVSVGWLPDPVVDAGSPVTFTAVVRNAGTEPTPDRTHGVGFWVDGTKVTWSAGSTAPLAAGEERTYTADGGPAGPAWTAEPGDHTVEAVVDDENRIPEADEQDNTASATLTVPTP